MPIENETEIWIVKQNSKKDSTFFKWDGKPVKGKDPQQFILKGGQVLILPASTIAIFDSEARAKEYCSKREKSVKNI